VGQDSELVREALRLYRRYAVEIVERFNLCPWAERAAKAGKVREAVLVDSEDPLASSLQRIEQFCHDSGCEVALLIYPRLNLGRLAFEQFVRSLREADAARYGTGRPTFAMATFHPDAAPDTASGERFIPFVRRTPDPTIQLVRFELLEQARARHPSGTEFIDIRLLDPRALQQGPPPLSLRERIAEQNLLEAQRFGVEELEALLLDIRNDRDRSYAKLGQVKK
jgi:hypothetical protein